MTYEEILYYADGNGWTEHTFLTYMITNCKFSPTYATQNTQSETLEAWEAHKAAAPSPAAAAATATLPVWSQLRALEGVYTTRDEAEAHGRHPLAISQGGVHAVIAEFLSDLE